MTKRSQIQAIGVPPPKTWQDYRDGCLMTFHGGYHDDVKLDTFQHGMNTVFNLLENELPSLLPAAAPEQADGVTEAETEGEERIDAASQIDIQFRRMAIVKMYDFGSDGRHMDALAMLDRIINDACALAITRLRADLATAEAEREAYGKGQERWDEMWRESEDDNTRLRADLATVTVERDEKIAKALSYHADFVSEREAKDAALRTASVAREMMIEFSEELDAERVGFSLEMENMSNLFAGVEADLEAERKALAETKGALISYNAALIEEQEHADRLADALREKTFHLHHVMNHRDNKTECRSNNCKDELAILAAHAARRVDGGAK